MVYLARAPKDVEVYQAYNKAKHSVRNHKGPLPSVPLHLRNASNKVLKSLGKWKLQTKYARRNYIYMCMYVQTVLEELLMDLTCSSAFEFKYSLIKLANLQ